MTFWPLTNNDFPTDQTSHQFHDLHTELNLHRIMSGFHGAFATGVASQQGTLTLPDTWFRPQIRDLLMLQLLRPNSSNLPCLYSTFHLEYPLVLSRFCSYMLWDIELKLCNNVLQIKFKCCISVSVLLSVRPTIFCTCLLYVLTIELEILNLTLVSLMCFFAKSLI